MGGGSRLRVVVRGVEIFSNKLFLPVRQDDVIWSLEDGQLHLTLTKAELDKLWNDLGEEVEVERDETGEPLPHTIPEPMSARERIDKFKQVIEGDDGRQSAYEDL